MADNDFYWELAELNPDAVVFEEFEEAYLGTAMRNGFKPVAVYSYNYIVNILTAGMLDDPKYMKELIEEGIVEEEEQVANAIDRAIEYFDYNVAGVGKGENNEDAPIFLHSPVYDEREDG